MLQKKLIPTINNIEADCGFVLKGLNKSFKNLLFTDKIYDFFFFQTPTVALCCLFDRVCLL